MKNRKPLFPEDNNFFLKFLENELIYSPNSLSDLKNISTDYQDLIIDNLNQNNNKTCLIFKSLDENSQLKTDSFLDKILRSMKIELEKSIIINLEKAQAIRFNDLHRTTFLPKKIILFGVNSSDLNMNLFFSENRVNLFLDYQIIKTKNLDELEHDVEAKKIFWKQLQTMFLNKE